MKEVEIKIQISDPEKIVKILTDYGCVFSEPITQRDVVYVPDGITTLPTPIGVNVLRIRHQQDKTLLTLKRRDSANQLSKLEHELEISDAGQMETIIKLLGFNQISDVTKIRRKCKIDDYEICFDNIKDLGQFLEMEKLTDENEDDIQAEMLRFLSSLNIDTSQRMDVGYDVLVFRKYGSK
jgi:adenylate cyclase class 2